MGKKAKVTNVKMQEPMVEQYQDIFQIVENNGAFLIGVADKVVTKQTFATSDEAKAYIDSKPWDLLINVSCLCYELSKENK